jgi:hypothetical protein
VALPHFDHGLIAAIDPRHVLHVGNGPAKVHSCPLNGIGLLLDGTHALPMKTVLWGDPAASKRYQQQLSLPLVPPNHFTRPIVTIILQISKCGAACFVNAQSASNSNQVGRRLAQRSMI